LGGAAEGERPAAYIIVLGDERIKQQFDMDAGIAAQTIMLGAAELGLGGCILSSVRRDELAALFGVTRLP
jgi:Nitroreductase family.